MLIAIVLQFSLKFWVFENSGGSMDSIAHAKEQLFLLKLFGA